MTTGSSANPLRNLSPDLKAELLAVPGAADLDPAVTGARDFYETAEIVAGLACVVSIDTAAAHLAGAMGKPLLVLLPYDADWRWATGDQTPWYPNARLFRQVHPGDWRTAIKKILNAVQI